MKHDPPKLPLRFFRWYCHPKMQDYIEGDLMEVYERRLKEKGKRKADIRFIIDVLLLLRPGIIRPVEGHHKLNTYGMYKSYFKIGWRNLLRNKGYSFINIGGLALGMTITLLISLWVYDELTFNRYFENYDHLAKVYRHNTFNGEVQSGFIQTPGLGTVLKEEYGSYFKNVAIVRGLVDAAVGTDEKNFTQKGFYAQPQFIEMLGLKMISGSQQGLHELKSIMISETLAKKLFPDGNAIDQIVTVESKWQLKVTGIYEELPKNTDFAGATYFLPFDLYLEGSSNSLTTWNNYFINIYVQIPPEQNASALSAVIKDAMLPHVDATALESKPEVFLLPMSKLHLASEFKNGVSVTSTKMQAVKYYSVIGIFVLFLACINFMNLSTARSEKRAREVGIRKSIGSVRGQLIQQFFSESILVTLISFLGALLLVSLVLPQFNTIADKDLTMPWTQPLFWLISFSLILVTGFLAGSYPALYLSSFQPLKVLKGTFKAGKFASMPRRVLVIFQFVVSVCLVAGTIIIYQQIQFAKNRPVGYTRQGLVTLASRSPEFKGKYEVLKSEFIATGAVENMAAANYEVTTTLGNNHGFGWKGKEAKLSDPSFNTVNVSHDYGKTIGWEFIMGRDFSQDFASDRESVVINESAWKLMGLENPIGEMITRDRGDHIDTYKIIGVTRDMVKGSPYEPTNPAINFLSEDDLRWKFIRLNPTMNPHDALPKIEAAFRKVIDTAPFDYTFADEEYESKFRSEERIGTLAIIFSVLAILISCLGLFGLSSFVAEQRTKEIGIRKVLGASNSNVWKLLSTEFMILVSIACSVSIPLTYYFMNTWLQQYNYHVTMGWYVFAGTSVSALIITMITVSVQAMKAAWMNPVTSLRSE